MTFISLGIVVALFGGLQAAAETGSVSGQVTVEETGAPLSGARVTLMAAVPRGQSLPFTRPLAPLEVVSGPDGRFLFPALTPGDYFVNVQRTGYARPLQRSNQIERLSVGAGPTTPLQIRMQKGAVIAGRVLDAAGAPMPDVRVVAMRRIEAPASAMAPRLMPVPIQGASMPQTNDLGEFRIAGLPGGEYYVAAMRGMGSPFGGPAVTPSANGTTVATTYYPGTSDQAAAQPVRVAAGDTSTNIEFAMQSVRAFGVSGIVVDENGSAVAGAMVMLTADPRAGGMMGPAGHTQSGPDGHFSIADVPAGTYRLGASIPTRVDSVGTSSGRSNAGAGVSGGFVGGGSSVTWSSTSGSGVSPDPPTDVVVSDANVTGVRVSVHRR